MQSVVEQIGGGTGTITERDIGGCDRRIENWAHVCKGSHRTKTCPQSMAYPQTGAPIHPSLQVVAQETSSTSLMSRCRELVTDNHTLACRGKDGRFAACKACAEHLHQLVYPRMYEVMITLLGDPSVPELDKQEYRVQLAAGLLTAVWGLRSL